MCESGGMAQTVNVIVAAEDRERLLAIAGDRNRPLKHVQRARIILLSAERLPVAEVARRAGVSRPAVWRWQRRYGEEGIDSLLRDKTRKPGRAPLSTGVVAKVLALTCSEPPGETTHWTGRAMAKAVGISLRAVQRLWEANRLQPHRLRTFKRSNDPKFAEKVEDVVGLYMDPPAHAVTNVLKWLAAHPRWTFHFTPTSASWLNAVEGFFAKLTRRRLRRGIFRSVADLKAAITRFVEETNSDPKPFVWTATAPA